MSFRHPLLLGLPSNEGWQDGRCGASAPHLLAGCFADAYDTLTAGCGAAGRPDRVLRFLLQEAGKRFDAALVKLLAHALGIYPPGSVVRLTTGEIGIVLRQNQDPQNLDRPLVRLLRDASGAPRTEIATLDLAERDSLRFVRSIETSVDPLPLGIAPAAVFLGKA